MKDTLTSAEYSIISRALVVGIVACESAVKECTEKGFTASAKFHQSGVNKCEAAYAVLWDLRTEG